MAITPKNKHIKDSKIPIRVALLLVGDTLAAANDELRNKLDKSGGVASDLILNQGFEVVDKKFVEDEKLPIIDLVNSYVNKSIELIITIGGTGPSPRDVTIESVRPILTKELPGFGEIFRALTYRDVGTVAIMTRALAGTIKDSAIICLPGSPNAVSLGVPLILSEIVHLINMIRKPNIGPIPINQFKTE